MGDGGASCGGTPYCRAVPVLRRPSATFVGTSYGGRRLRPAIVVHRPRRGKARREPHDNTTGGKAGMREAKTERHFREKNSGRKGIEKKIAETAPKNCKQAASSATIVTQSPPSQMRPDEDLT